MNNSRLTAVLVAAALGAGAGAGLGGPMEDAEAARARADYRTAERLWRPLAEAGDASAQRQLGRLYQHGLGVRKDAAEAYLWLTLAGARLPPGPLREETLYDRDVVAARLSPAELAELQARALEWLPREGLLSEAPVPQHDAATPAPQGAPIQGR